MKHLHLIVESFCDETSEVDPNDEWDRPSTSTSWDVLGISLSDKDGEHALPADFDVNVGDDVHVVYAVYSTGNSFGHDEGYSLEVISFHKNIEIANENAESARGARENFVIKMDNGEVVNNYCPWNGYFESLDYVEVKTFKVQARF